MLGFGNPNTKRKWNSEEKISLQLMYKNGEGVPQDRVEAEKWISMAREQGNDKNQSSSG